MRDHWEELGVDGKIILNIYLRAIGWEGVDWMHLTPYRDQ
jgi:hypothetical protein